MSIRYNEAFSTYDWLENDYNHKHGCCILICNPSNQNMKDDIIKSDRESKKHPRGKDSSGVGATNSPEIISGNGKSSKKRLLIIGLLLLLLVGLGLFYQSNINDNYMTNRQNTEIFNKLSIETAKEVEERKFDSALSAWQSFLRRDLSPELKCQASIKYADVLLKSGSYMKSSSLYQQIKIECPKTSEYFVALGLAKSYEGYGELTKAIAKYEEVIAIEKNWQINPPKDFNRAKSEENVANYTEIIKVLQANL